MSVSDPKTIDAMTVSGGQLVMLISDHLRWDGYQAEHLSMLQDKLNTYIRYIDSGGYKEKYSGADISSFVIDVVFLHPFDIGFVRMVELVRPELDKRNITIKYRISNSRKESAK